MSHRDSRSEFRGQVCRLIPGRSAYPELGKRETRIGATLEIPIWLRNCQAWGWRLTAFVSLADGQSLIPSAHVAVHSTHVAVHSTHVAVAVHSHP